MKSTLKSHALIFGAAIFLTSLSAWPLPFFFNSQAESSRLPEDVAVALQKSAIPLENVAVLVQALDAAAPLLSLNAAQPMNPASTMKLLTTYAALESFGSAHVWKTGVWADGEIRGGKLQGDLIIRGGGDPYLTLERMWLLQRALRQKGLREIDGNLLLDFSFYELPPLDAGAFDGEPLAAYNAVPSSLAANFNTQMVRLSAQADEVVIKAEIPLTDVWFLSRLSLTDSPCNAWRSQINAGIPDPVTGEVLFEGSYPRVCGERSLALNLFDPSRNFAQIFRALWEESGGIWNGRMAAGTAPLATPPLLEFESPPLADIIRPLNKYSSNIMTRMLLLNLGAKLFGAPATPEKSVAALRSVLQQGGLDFPELVLENGAGLSRLARISANSMNLLLRAASRSRHFSEFESSLPVAAVDGTMKSRVNGVGAAGHAHLKTGSLNHVKSLAGYVMDKHGRQWALVFFINHEQAERGVLAQDALVEWLYQGGGTSAEAAQ